MHETIYLTFPDMNKAFDSIQRKTNTVEIPTIQSTHGWAPHHKENAWRIYHSKMWKHYRWNVSNKHWCSPRRLRKCKQVHLLPCKKALRYGQAKYQTPQEKPKTTWISKVNEDLKKTNFSWLDAEYLAKENINEIGRHRIIKKKKSHIFTGADLDHVTYCLWRTKILTNCSKSFKTVEVLVLILIFIQINVTYTKIIPKSAPDL